MGREEVLKSIVTRPMVGWREWVSLPALGVGRIKAKIDTGARSSSLHAFGIEIHEIRGKAWVRFLVHPLQHSRAETIEANAPLLEYRHVRSSSGHETRRPVIQTHVMVGSYAFPIELTLASRDAMGFRMLLGRQAVRDRFLVHSGQSFLHVIPSHHLD